MNDNELDSIINDEWTRSTTDLAERYAPDASEVDRLTSLATSKAPELDPKKLGLGDLTLADWHRLEAKAQKPVDFFEVDYGKKHIPGVGVGFEFADLADQQIAALAVGAGTATYEQQLKYAEGMVEASRERTVMGRFAEITTDTTPLIVEGAAAYVGGAGAAALAARGFAKAGLAAAAAATKSTIAKRAAQIGLMTAAREGVVQGSDAVGLSDFGGGAWSANSLRRAIPNMDLSDEEIEHITSLAEGGGTEALLGKAFETNPLARGFGEELLRNTVEFGVGPAIASLTAGAIKRGLFGAALRKTVAATDDGLGVAQKIRSATGQDGPFTEVLEENISGVAVEARYGEDWQHGLTDDVYDVAAIAMLGAIPGLSGAALAATKRVMDSRRAAARGRIKAAQADSAAKLGLSVGGTVTLGGQQGTVRTVDSTGQVTVDFGDGTTGFYPGSMFAEQKATAGTQSPAGAATSPNGGDASAPVEATAATAGVEPGVSFTAVPPEALQSFAEQAGIQGATQVAPRTDAEAEAVQMAKLFGREVVLVSGKGGRRASGMIDSEGRMFVHAETASPLGVAMHEMGHDLADTLGETEFRKELEGLEAVAPGMVARYRDRWMRRNEASQARGEFADDGTRAAGGMGPKPAAVETPEFKEWFGDSKAVDADGKPLVVYHGTASHFTDFEPSRLGQTTQSLPAREGFWFVSGARVAGAYADFAATDAKVNALGRKANRAARAKDWKSYDALIAETEEFRRSGSSGIGSNVVPVHLQLSNPFEYDANGKNLTDIQIEAYGAIVEAKRQGHDGVIIRNLDDTPGLQNDPSTHYLVFRPNQIKSATGNRGTFDGSNPDIRFTGKDAPSSGKPTADLATEEGFTSLAEEYAALISYASTTQGRADVKVIAEHSPTVFRRMVDAVKRFVGKFKPHSPLGALDRIQKATRTRPDRAAAQLSLYLADLYKRGFGVQDAAAAAEGGTQAGGTLLEQLQREAEARGLPVVRPRAEASTGAATAPDVAPRPGQNSGQPGQQNAPVATPETDTAARPGQESGQESGQAPSVKTTQAVPVGGPGPLLNEDAVPRPDLNNPLKSPETRALVDEVDRARNEQGLPEPRTRKEVEAFALAELQRDYDGTRFEIESKIETGELLKEWETHALIEIIEAVTLKGYAGDAVAYADAIRLGEAYRAVRSETSRALSTVAGRGRSAKDAVLDMMLMATRANRRKRAKIQAEVDGIMRLVSPFKNQRARYLRTRHQMEQERKNDRFAPNRELKFAPGLLDERGKPVTEARLEYLQSQLEKIEADEAARAKRAGEAVAAQGYNLEALDMETLIDPYDGWRIRNAISEAKATLTDKFLELRYMNMLSGLATHARNTSGNAAMLVLDGPVLKTAEATAQMFLKLIDATGKTNLADPEGATYTEVLHWFKGFANAMQPAFRNMLTAYRTQGPAFEMDLQASGTDMGIYAHDFGSKLDFVPGPKISGKPAKVLRHLSLNTLMASDEYFKTIMAIAEVQSLAFRQAAGEGLKGDARSQRMQELIDDRSSTIWTQGLYKAREGTFQDEGGLATQKTAEVIQRVVGNLDDVFETYAKTPLGTILIPFRKTPLRIAGRALRLTPLQAAMIPARAIAGDYRGNQAALVRDLADAMLAWGLTFAIMELVDMEDEEGRPFITGPRSDNPAESSLDYATNFPMSILVDGTYYDYSRFEPAATGLGMLVGVAEEFKKTGATESLSAMLQSAVAQTKDKTFLRTIGDIMDLADSTRSGKDRTLGFLRDTFVTPMVPNIIRQTARESDDVLRERRTTDGGQAAFWLDGIYATAEDSLAKLTGAEAKEPRYTAWGEPIKRPFAKKGGTDTLLRLLSPIQPKLDTKDTSRLDLALLTWERKVSSGEVEDARVYYPGRPSSSFKIDGEDYTMTPNEYARYVRTSGKAAAESILSNKGINLDDPSEKDIDAIRKTVNKERAAFRKKLEDERRKLNTQ